MAVLRASFEGILLGLSLALLLGPAFFSLLQTSIERGFRFAVRFAIGVFFSDLFLVLLACFGASSLLNTASAKNFVGMVGGIVLVAIGIHTFRKKVNLIQELGEQELIVLPSHWTYVFKGFFMNLANPATWLFWIFWVGVISSQYSDESGLMFTHILAFFGGALLTVLVTDTLKAYLAGMLKRFITNSLIRVINRIVGIVLGLFGFFLFVRSVSPFLQILHQMFME